MKRSAASRSNSLPALESQLQRLDHEQLKLMNQRAQLALKVGKARQAAGQPAFVLGEEEQAVARLVELSKGPLPGRVSARPSGRSSAGRGPCCTP